MKTNEFDDLIKLEFDHNDFDYSLGHWQGIQRQLKEKKQKATTFFWPASGIAAGMALLFSALIIYTNHKRSIDLATLSQSGFTTQSAQVQKTPSVPPSGFSKKQSNIAINTNKRTFVKNGHSEPKISSQLPLLSRSDNSLTKNPLENRTENNRLLPPRHEDMNHTERINLNNVPLAIAGINKTAGNTIHTPDSEDPELRTTKTTSISLSGGVNYGTLNRSYALGGTAYHQINNRIYIEGDLSFINGSMNTTSVTYVGSGNPNMIGISLPKIPQYTNGVSDFDYLQFSPSIGYNISKKFSFGLGPDIQRLLLADPLPGNLVTDENKTLPGFDFGLIGKSEYRLTRRLKAGLQYREGLNNLITNSNKYFDRNYLQVQVKFNVFEK